MVLEAWQGWIPSMSLVGMLIPAWCCQGLLDGCKPVICPMGSCSNGNPINACPKNSMACANVAEALLQRASHAMKLNIAQGTCLSCLHIVRSTPDLIAEYSIHRVACTRIMDRSAVFCAGADQFCCTCAGLLAEARWQNKAPMMS